MSRTAHRSRQTDTALLAATPILVRMYAFTRTHTLPFTHVLLLWAAHLRSFLFQRFLLHLGTYVQVCVDHCCAEVRVALLHHREVHGCVGGSRERSTALEALEERLDQFVQALLAHCWLVQRHLPALLTDVLDCAPALARWALAQAMHRETTTHPLSEIQSRFRERHTLLFTLLHHLSLHEVSAPVTEAAFATLLAQAS
jgi:hypothetical protein